MAQPTQEREQRAGVEERLQRAGIPPEDVNVQVGPVLD